MRTMSMSSSESKDALIDLHPSPLESKLSLSPVRNKKDFGTPHNHRYWQENYKMDCDGEDPNQFIDVIDWQESHERCSDHCNQPQKSKTQFPLSNLEQQAIGNRNSLPRLKRTDCSSCYIAKGGGKSSLIQRNCHGSDLAINRSILNQHHSHSLCQINCHNDYDFQSVFACTPKSPQYNGRKYSLPVSSLEYYDTGCGSSSVSCSCSATTSRRASIDTFDSAISLCSHPVSKGSLSYSHQYSDANRKYSWGGDVSEDACHQERHCSFF